MLAHWEANDKVLNQGFRTKTRALGPFGAWRRWFCTQPLIQNYGRRGRSRGALTARGRATGPGHSSGRRHGWPRHVHARAPAARPVPPAPGGHVEGLGFARYAGWGAAVRGRSMLCVFFRGPVEYRSCALSKEPQVNAPCPLEVRAGYSGTPRKITHNVGRPARAMQKDVPRMQGDQRAGARIPKGAPLWGGPGRAVLASRPLIGPAGHAEGPGPNVWPGRGGCGAASPRVRVACVGDGESRTGNVSSL